VSGLERAGRVGGVRAGSRRQAPRVLVFLAILLAVSGHIATARAAAHWRIAPAPGWPVMSAPLRAVPAPLGNDADASGQHVQLLAHEARIATSAESFWHVTSRITSQAGLQASSQLNVEFDPSYQTLVFHYVQVLRGETRINLLRSRSIKEIQREAGLENQVFDSRESAVIFLEDLRVGDVVDYAYSLQGSDPTLAGTIDDAFVLGLSVPVDHLVARLVTDRDRELSVSLHGPTFVHEATLAPRISHDSTEYRWDLWATKAYPLETDAPKWFDPLPFASISGFKTWHDVAAWGGRFFSGLPAIRGPLAFHDLLGLPCRIPQCVCRRFCVGVQGLGQNGSLYRSSARCHLQRGLDHVSAQFSTRSADIYEWPPQAGFWQTASSRAGSRYRTRAISDNRVTKSSQLDAPPAPLLTRTDAD
jgi:hypothetical protein